MSCLIDCPFSSGSITVRLEPGDEIETLRSRCAELQSDYDKLHKLYESELILNARLIGLCDDNGIKWRKIK